MGKNLSPAVLAQVLSPRPRPALFLQIAFLTETIWLWNGLGPSASSGPAYNPNATFPYGQTFLGMGWMGQIQSVPEVADVVAQNIRLLLTGIPSELVNDAINAVRQNSIATLWLAFLDPGNNIIPDPVQIFQGSLDVPTLTEGADTFTISITAENPLIDLNRAPNRRFTDIDQQLDFPGDTGFFQVQLLQDYNFTWPSPFGTTDADTAPPNFITVAPGVDAPVAVAVGGTVQLTPTITQSTGTTYVPPVGQEGGSFYSSDPAIATVTIDGLVTGVSPGFCVMTKRYVLDIYCTGDGSPSNNVSASVTVVVTEVAP